MIPKSVLLIEADGADLIQIAKNSVFSRKATDKAFKELFDGIPETEENQELTKYSRFKRVWIVVPPNTEVPRLEAKITKIMYLPQDQGDGFFEYTLQDIKQVGK